MKIGIDIDCVLNDLVEKWILYLNTKYDLNVTYDDITTYEMIKHFPELTIEQIYEPLYLTDFWESLVPRKDSIHYLKKLVDEGHTIKLITATVVENMQIKCDWILKYFPFINKNDIWMVFDKTWINTDILLDDNIDNLKGESYTPICYSQPWNKTFCGFRVNDWAEFYDMVNYMN